MSSLKRFNDFELKIVTDEIYKFYRESGYSDDEIEELIPNSLEFIKDKMDIKVPCKYCGVKFPLNNLNHECEEEDIWLFSYTQNANDNKKLKRGYKTKLKRKYPLVGSKLAFRGINFFNEEDFNKFMEECKRGTVEFKEISSWSKSYNTAKKFARCLQKGTSVDVEFIKAEIRKAVNEKSSITGYKGVILAIDLKRKDVLCDINGDGFGSFAEEEVILLPGTYEVNIVNILDKEYGKTFDLSKDIKVSVIEDMIISQF